MEGSSKNTNTDKNQGLISVTGQTSNSHAWSGSQLSTHVLFHVKTGVPKEEISQRAPLNLAIVLDKSGSMQQESKLENAKAAIIKVIEALNNDDILHLVIYGSSVTVVFEGQSPVLNRERLIAQVKTISCSGCTNLWGGVEKAAELITAHHKQGYTRRMFLFSDGQVNEGLKDPKKIQQRVAQDIYTTHLIKVSSFGLGSDFDETLMRGIAECGSGTYFFIAGSDSIPLFVTTALSSLLRAIALDAVLHVRPAQDFVTIEKIYAHSVEQGIRFGDLQTNNTRSAVACVEISASQKQKLNGHVKILDWELDYNSVSSSANDLSRPISMTGSVYIHFTDDANAIMNGENKEVRIRAVLQQTAEMDTELVKLIDGGQNDKAKEAAKIQIELLESVLSLDEDGSFKVAAELKQAKDSLEQMSQDVQVYRKVADHRGYRKRRASVSYDGLFL
eukprot:TRINITY_DN14594_c0_g1_i1.p1 TRINITY_DN14594_c0_g1~~TRINITY_DN14594_c0_g1_i1.p1  ORF type:complete len:447 (+),score=97.15 TRINITY_DN14594_c0_g1_i1:94-1434(+)